MKTCVHLCRNAGLFDVRHKADSKSCYPRRKGNKTDLFYGTAVAWFHSCRFIPAELSEHITEGPASGTSLCIWSSDCDNNVGMQRTRNSWHQRAHLCITTNSTALSWDFYKHFMIVKTESFKRGNYAVIWECEREFWRCGFIFECSRILLLESDNNKKLWAWFIDIT